MITLLPHLLRLLPFLFGGHRQLALDFFTVPTAGRRVLFVLVVLAHHRRHVVHFNVTEHPTAHWTAQQIIDAFPDDSAPCYLLRDRDQIYGEHFRRRVKGMNIEEVVIATHSPWQNPFAERLIRAIRRGSCSFQKSAACTGRSHRTTARYPLVCLAAGRPDARAL